MQIAYENAATAGDTKYTFTGTIIGKRGNNFYMQDGEFGMYVYAGSKDWLDGITDTKITVTSKLTVYQGLIETNGIDTVVGAGTGDVITPLNVTSKASMENAKQNILASASNAVLKERPSSSWSSSSDFATTFTIGEDDITVFFAKQAYTSAPESVKTMMNGSTVNQVFDLTNFVSTVNKNVFQLVYTSASTPILHEEHASAIAFKESSYDVNQGATKDMSKEVVLTPASATDPITYAVSGNDDVTIDSKGVVTVDANAVAESTAKVTATVFGLDPAETTIVVKGTSPTTQSYKLVTNAANLADGDKIVIASADMTMGMKAFATGDNNCKATAITVEDNVITSLGDSAELTLESAGDGKFYINSSAGYLYAASGSANYLKAKSAKDSENGVWEFTYSEGVMGIVASGSSNRNVMRYNSGSSLFSCYASTSTTGTLMQVFKLS